MHYWQGKKAIETAEVLPAYLLAGEETFLRDEIIAILARQFLGSNFSKEQIEKVSASEHSLKTIMEKLFTPSLFGGGRFLVVYNAPYFGSSKNKCALSAADEKMFFDYFSRKDRQTLVVFTCLKADRRRKFVKFLESAGAVIECSVLRRQALRRWVEERLHATGNTITDEALENLVLATNSQLCAIASELEKIITYLGLQKQITVEAANELLSQDNQGNVFKLVDALGEQNLDRARLYLKKLLYRSEPPVLILHMIVRHYRLLYRAKFLCQQSVELKDAASNLGVPYFVVRKLFDQARSYPLDSLGKAMLTLQQTDYRLKTGRIEAGFALEMLIVSLIGMKQEDHELS